MEGVGLKLGAYVTKGIGSNALGLAAGLVYELIFTLLGSF